MRLIAVLLLALIAAPAVAQEPKLLTIQDIEMWIYAQKKEKAEKKSDAINAPGKIVITAGTFIFHPLQRSIFVIADLQNNTTKPVNEFVASANCNVLKLPKTQRVVTPKIVNPGETATARFPLAEPPEKGSIKKHETVKVTLSISGSGRIELKRGILAELSSDHRGQDYDSEDINAAFGYLAEKQSVFGWAMQNLRSDNSLVFFDAQLEETKRWTKADVIKSLEAIKQSQTLPASGLRVIDANYTMPADHSQFQKEGVVFSVEILNDTEESQSEIYLTFFKDSAVAYKSNAISLSPPIAPGDARTLTHAVSDALRMTDLTVAVNASAPKRAVRRIDLEKSRSEFYTTEQIKLATKEYAAKRGLFGWAYANLNTD